METTEQPLTQEEKDQRWIQIIEAYQQSDMSVAEWVRNRDDITYDQFMWNRKRLFPDAGRAGQFLSQETTWSSITMEMPSSSFDVYINDFRVVVKSGFDQELFRELMEVLKR